MIYDDGFPIKLKDYLKKNAKIRVFEEKWGRKTMLLAEILSNAF
jgi:hypothetical protein